MTKLRLRKVKEIAYHPTVKESQKEDFNQHLSVSNALCSFHTPRFLVSSTESQIIGETNLGKKMG